MNWIPAQFASLKSRTRCLLMCAFLAVGALPLAAQTLVAQTATLPGQVVKSLANATRLPHTSQMDEEQIRQCRCDPNTSQSALTIGQCVSIVPNT
jgi:hypothetical protein